jgi:hypothetical protein
MTTRTSIQEDCTPKKMTKSIFRKCIAVAEMIISLHKNNFTPFNLGLALQLYHGYGSKHLIETLYAFGMCVSYTEVRQFLTSEYIS